MSVQTGVQVLVQDVPERLLFSASNYASTSDALLQRRQIALSPRHDTTYDETTTEITINISANTSFLDLENSYITGKLLTNGTAKQLNTLLEQGGIHALFSEVELQVAATNTVVERMNLYNVFQSIESEFIHSPIEAEYFGGVELDGPENSELIQIGSSTTACAVAQASNTTLNLTADGNIALQEIAIGDMMFNTTNGTWHQITAISSGGLITFTPGLAQSGDPAAYSSFLNAFFFRKKQRKNPRFLVGQKAAAQQYVRFVMRPKLGFFRQKKLLPLFLMAGGMNLVLRLDPALSYHSFIANLNYQAEADTAAASSVTLSEVRFNAVLIDAHSKIVTDYINMYRKEGLLIPMTAYSNFTTYTNSSSGLQAIELRPGCRSAKWAFSRLISDDFWASNSIHSRAFKCLSMHLDYGCRAYQYEAGAHTFPIRPINVFWTAGGATTNNDQYPMEMIKQWDIMCQRITDAFGASSMGMTPHYQGPARRSSPDDCRLQIVYVKDNTAAAAYSTDDYFPKWIMAVPLARDLEGRFAGIDLGVSPLRLYMDFKESMPSTFGSQRVVQTFIAYDQYFHLSERDGATVLS